jgi:hypothetical protein
MQARRMAVIWAALLAAAACALPGPRAALSLEMQARPQQLHAGIEPGALSLSLRLGWSA